MSTVADTIIEIHLVGRSGNYPLYVEGTLKKGE